LRENELLYSSHLPLGVANGLVIHHASLKSSGCIRLKVFTLKRRNYSREAKIYATSTFCSVAAGGAVASSSAARGGVEATIVGVEEVGAKEAAEAAEGEIIDTMAGFNLFAFSKKGFNSDQV
jgi:hypothetical protein